MDGLGGHYVKWSEVRDTGYCKMSLKCGIWKIQQTSELNRKEIDSQIKLNKLVLPVEREEGGDIGIENFKKKDYYGII